LERLGLSDAADQAISTYSKGMKQKTLLIAALLHDPEILILDEPESGLDVGSILLLRNLIRVLAARGRGILYSSHVVENVERLCTRVIVLSSAFCNTCNSDRCHPSWQRRSINFGRDTRGIYPSGQDWRCRERQCSLLFLASR
jgi:ABC-type Na+ transport system ATPase subunit NatA